MFFNKKEIENNEDDIVLDNTKEQTPTSHAELYNRELDLLYDVTLAIISTDGKEVCDVITRLLGEFTKSKVCSLWFFENGQVLKKVRKGFYSIENELLQKLSTADFELMEKLVEAREPLLIGRNHSTNDPTINKLFYALGMPIIVHGEIMGVLNLWKYKEENVDFFSDKQLSTLSKAINNIACGIANNLFNRQHQDRIKKELQIAQRIQVNLMPKKLPRFSGITIGVRADSANEVGGDYLDLIETSNKNLGIVIGDVMGKGIPASLHMVMTRTVFRTTARNDISPDLVLKEINNVLYPDLSPQGIFVTLFYGLYHPTSKLLLYANAAHNPPIVLHAATGEFTLLKAKGVFIGGKEDPEYTLQSIQLASGDIVVFYSDGLKEAMNKKKEQYGIDRIKDNIKKYSFYDAASISDCLFINQSKFTEHCEQADDITIAVLKVE